MIIYHADDYGISINASKEILSLVQQGKLSGISVIPNMSCFADCIDLLLPVMKERPALTVALHLNFFEGHCCADPAKIPGSAQRDLHRFPLQPAPFSRAKISARR